MIKTIRCPKCNHTSTIAGNPEETKQIECPNCGLKGKFTFPKEIEISEFVEEMVERPLGITILAALQIIGVIILIILLFLLPLISDESINEFFVFPIIGILFLYSLFIIPVSVLLAYGLLSGKEWARFASVLFEITSVITSIIRFNVFSAIIPIFIISYLYQPKVKKYFRTEKGLNTNVKSVIVVGVAILLIFNGYFALLSNPLKIMNNGNVFGNIPDGRYYGTWENETKNIEITFYSNKSFFINNETHSYWGTWDNIVDPWPILILYWEEGEGRYMPIFLDSKTVTFAKESGKSGFFGLVELERKS